MPDIQKKNPFNLIGIVTVCSVVALCNSGSTNQSSNTQFLIQQAQEKLLQSNNYKEAITLLQQALTIDASMDEAYYYLGLSYVSAQQWKKAEESLRQSIRRLKHEIPAKYQLGKIYLEEMAKTDEAIRLLSDVFLHKPDHGEAQILLAEAYIRTHCNQKAIDLLQPMVSDLFDHATQDHFPYYVLLGRAHFGQKQYTSAADYLRLAIQIHPFQTESYFHLANCYFQMNKGTRGHETLQLFEQRRQEEQKIAPIKRQLDNFPNNPAAWLELGLLEMDRHNWASAEQAFETCIRLDETSTEGFEALAQLHVKTDDYSKAIQIYQQLLEHDGKNANYWNNLGYAYVMMENFEQARHHFQRAFQLEPDNHSFELNLSRVDAILSQDDNPNTE